MTCVLLLLLSLSACSKQELKQWDCTVVCAGQSNDDSYIVSYSEEEILSDTGELTFQNQNDFDIVVHLLEDGEETTLEVGAHEVTICYQIHKETVYTVGCHADVEEGMKIKLMVYDSGRSEPYSI